MASVAHFKVTKHKITVILMTTIVIATGPQMAGAIGSNSYQIKEDVLDGTGGSSSSAGYRATDTAGDNAANGGAAGTMYSSQSGPQTASEPTLAFSVDSSSVSLGSLSTSLTRTGTAVFSVLNYTSYGYIVQVIGNPPNNGAYTLNAMASAAGSTTNTEQFGINLVANTSPLLGADPLQVAGASFGFGSATSGYNTPNVFKYVSGDTIAQATKSSGKTTYTVTFIANIANSTPGGSYSGNQTLIVTGTY